MIPSGKLQENFKFTVKVNNSHVYIQNVDDLDGSILKNPENLPEEWLHNPRGSEIDQLIEKVKVYEKQAKDVRHRLLTDWLNEVLNENKKLVDPVGKLNSLQEMRENVWPCQNCTNTSIFIA